MGHYVRQYTNPQGQRTWFVWHRVLKSASTTVTRMISHADGVGIDDHHCGTHQLEYDLLNRIVHTDLGANSYQPWSRPTTNSDPFHTVVITRSPRDRWQSVYQNLIVDAQCLGHTPTVDWVQANWAEVMANPLLSTHFASITQFAGTPLDHTDVIPITELSRLSDLMTHITGRPIPVPHLHQSSHLITLTQWQKQWIDGVYQEDYDLGWWPHY